MPNEDSDNVTNFLEHKRRIEHERGHELHERGEAFRLDVFEIDHDSDVPNGVGTVDGEYPIVVFVNISELRGICMTAAMARQLAKDLTEAADTWDVEQATPKEGS